ncbi:MAG: CDP-2,3-bis-(O-geranylgeranyl)-sn-glycerol synthase, partial [Candidatus Aenigmatarchaeota archaeon]
MWGIILNSLWLVLPAYCANFFPVFLKGRRPLDFGRKFSDGRRIFGDGKTWEGLIGGAFFGFAIGIIQIFLQNGPLLGVSSLAFHHTYLTVFVLPFAALLGDIIGSFFKRRFGMKRGAEAPLLDQLDFLVFSLAAVSIFAEI